MGTNVVLDESSIMNLFTYAMDESHNVFDSVSDCVGFES